MMIKQRATRVGEWVQFQTAGQDTKGTTGNDGFLILIHATMPLPVSIKGECQDHPIHTATISGPQLGKMPCG